MKKWWDEAVNKPLNHVTTTLCSVALAIIQAVNNIICFSYPSYPIQLLYALHIMMIMSLPYMYKSMLRLDSYISSTSDQ